MYLKFNHFILYIEGGVNILRRVRETTTTINKINNNIDTRENIWTYTQLNIHTYIHTYIM